MHVRDDAAWTFERCRDFGNQTHVHLARRERGVRGDEAGLPAHETNEPDTVPRAPRFDRGASYRLDGFIHGCLEPERPIEKQNVVIDGFRHAHDGRLRVASAQRGIDGERAGVGTVAADDEQKVEVELVARDGIDDIVDIRTSAAAA